MQDSPTWIRRVRKVDRCQTDENHPPRRFLSRGAHCLSDRHLPEPVGKRAGYCVRDAQAIYRTCGLSEPRGCSANCALLWRDPAIPQIMDYHSSKFYLMDSASYFFTEAERIGNPNYIPSETDVLRCRQKSTGIVETRFSVPPLSIHMFDVGGQRSERKKWIHCFESVTSIIFCTALSEYDQVLLEQRNQNRMAESLELFDSIINSRWFLRTSIILFMNKIDVFRNKLPKVPLERYFPEYTGGPDVNKAAKYILWRFMQANRARLSVYPHLTQATDTPNIRLVLPLSKRPFSRIPSKTTECYRGR